MNYMLSKEFGPKPTTNKVFDAEPCPEILQIMEQFDFDPKKIKQWYSVPALNPIEKRVSRKELMANGGVDAVELASPFLGNPIMDGTLRTMDVANGCGHHCDTCLAGAVLPSRLFSYESLTRLFGKEDFLKTIQPDSLRIGSAGDIMDHPQAIEILQMMLDATEGLYKESLDNAARPFMLKVFTNYRPIHEEKILGLYELAKENGERLRVTLSLPLNIDDTVNRLFTHFALKNPQIFKGSVENDGLFFPDFFGSTPLSNFGIQDVRHPRVLFTQGRVLSHAANDGRVPLSDWVDNDRDTEYSARGFVKTFLNPDAMWLMAYVTMYESHTNRLFVPMTQDNIDVLSHLPYHPDFPTPPNWPGGTGTRKPFNEHRAIRLALSQSGKEPKKPVVIG